MNKDLEKRILKSRYITLASALTQQAMEEWGYDMKKAMDYGLEEATLRLGYKKKELEKLFI